MALLNVQIALPTRNAPRTKRFEAVIDSGASRCLFHASIGQFIGLDVEKGEVEETNGISGTAIQCLHNIAIYILGGVVNIRAGFSDGLPLSGLLGMNGFFEHFNVTFDATGKMCTLERLYQA